MENIFEKLLVCKKSVSRCVFNGEYEERSRVKIIPRRSLLFARYIRALSCNRPRYERKTKRNPHPSLSWSGVVTRVPSHFTVVARRSRSTGRQTRMGFLLARVRRSVDRLAGLTLLTCTWRVSPWSWPNRFSVITERRRDSRGPRRAELGER